MNILLDARNILEKEGFRTKVLDTSDDLIYFEDEWQMGFIKTYTKLESILENWEHDQDEFLQNNAAQIIEGNDKAWNIYSVFLTSDSISPSIRSHLQDLEEDFRASRKIVGSDIKTQQDLVQVLLPLLKIQSHITLKEEDPMKRIMDRLNSLNSPLVLLSQDMNSKQIADKLSEES